VQGDAAAAEAGAFDFDAARKLMIESCGDCHAEGAQEGGFAIEPLTAEPESLVEEFERWQTVRQRVNDRSMPPVDAEPVEDAARHQFVEWVERASTAALSQLPPRAGPPLLRRLSRHEYANTVRDLLNVHFDAGQALPEDAAGGEGFTNAAETLVISPIHAEKYLEAATNALQYAARNEATRKRLLVERPEDVESEIDAARTNLTRFAERAFRRPVAPDEVARYVALFESAREDELPFDEALFYAMRGILISPSFLFIAEAAPSKPGVAQPLTDHELAVRLSYFLWASMPDDELRAAADTGALSNEAELRKQTLRMLTARGTHLQDSLEQFVAGWLGTADLGRAKKIDRDRHPQIKDPHVAALRNQPIYFLESVLQENESLLRLIDADWTFLNNELVKVYRLDRGKIEGDFVQRLKRVKLAPEYGYRGGLLGMGGIYVVSSYPRRSSPVLRGAWVLEKLLGVELPPPPPDVPELEEGDAESEAATLRERLERHRADASCASCHNRIDPLGFALENFDEIGRWRNEDGGSPINAVAALPGGREIDGVQGLKEYLLQEKVTFVRNLTRKMLGYALGRSLRPSDLSTVERIVERLEQHDYRAQELVWGIVKSAPFRQKMSSVAPETGDE
jgi:mono/diheme cytochrome c family protein